MWKRTAARILAKGALGILLLVLVTSCSALGFVNFGDRDSASGKVKADGFRLRLSGGITVSAPSGVAPANTKVSADVVPARIPDSHSFAVPVGPAVDIKLEDDQQPAAPVTIEFAIPEDVHVAPETLFVLGQSKEPGRSADFVESSWNPASRTLTATTDHLSWYAVTQVDSENLTERFGQWIGEATGTRSAKPDCVDAPGASGTYTLAEPWPTAAWVCAQEKAGTTEVTLHSNSGLVFTVDTEPEGVFSPLTAFSVSGIATAVAATRMQAEGLLKGQGVLLPGEKITVTFQQPVDAVQFRLTAAPGLTQINVLATGVALLLPPHWSAALDWGQCAVDQLTKTTVGRLRIEQLQAMTSCLAAAGGTAGDLLALLTWGPTTVRTQLDGINRELQGTNVERFTVYLVAADARRELPSGARWLYEIRNSGTLTSGKQDIATLPDGTSYPFSTNQWVGCGVDNETRFALNGNWSTLDFAWALQFHTPPGLIAHVTIIADDTPVFMSSTTLGQGLSRRQLDVRGVQELTVRATTNSECTSAAKGYGALVQAYVS
ncbi:MAG TPA: hypothetical protein GXZ30_05085 [Propionibacterium sp.]|nr:hypothetical protein [Propionibacterium sp.]